MNDESNDETRRDTTATLGSNKKDNETDDGKRHVTVTPAPAVVTVTAGSVSVVISEAVSTATGVIESNPNIPGHLMDVVKGAASIALYESWNGLVEAAKLGVDQLRDQLKELLLQLLPNVSDEVIQVTALQIAEKLQPILSSVPTQ